MSALESENVDRESELNYAKQIFSHDKSETKILVLGWNKSSDKIFVVIPFMKEKKATKRTILSELASVYNPIGLISQAHLLRKLLYREIFNLKLSWD